jgi:hypothetical protein
MPATTVLDLIGNTPMVEVRRLDTGPCRLFLKLECQNPGGSIKDRIGRSMIEAAERDSRSSRPRRATDWCSWCPTRWRARRSSTCARWAPKCA